MRHTYHFWPVIDRRYYTAIGHAVVVWAFLEIEIDHQINSLLHSKKTWQHPLSKKMDRALPRTFKKRITLWKRLARIHFTGEELTGLQAIITRCKIARSKRDKVAHGKWMAGYGGRNEPDIIYVNLPRDGVEYDREEPMTVEQIRTAASEITLIIRDLMTFEKRAFPPTLPPPPDPESFQRELKR